MHRLSAFGRSAAMVIAAFALGSLVFLVSGYNVSSIWSGTVQGAISAPGALQNTLRWTIPLVIAGLGVLVSFRAGFFNVGAQGQIYVGALTATVVGLAVPAPGPLLSVLCALAGMAGGAVWALIAAVLKVVFGTDEVLSTLMLNFIAVLLVQYVAGGPLRDKAGSSAVASTTALPQDARVSNGLGVSPTLLIVAILAVVLVWVWASSTRSGLTTELLGRNPVVVRWQGASSGRLAFVCFGAAGAAAGLAGSLDVLGPAGRLVAGFSPDIGFTAVLVALVGMLTVPGVVLAGLLFGGLQAALQYLPTVSDIPRSALDLIQGLIAVLITLQVRSVWRKRARVPKPDQNATEPSPTAAETADV
ncbi:ABC transporter permease [Leifsonia sp. fls2-241-R2A-40a]|uniref:ABC transporter permease n=1 Tax=Leifsonia sp. fls2-241-R2A-40a TaxID=3040290 RepID=UPI00254A6B50|nr:ABC transporter permease [Leifsonia sp. fls2-241-R2A-40a]